MFGIENITVFIGTGLLLNIYPGPDTLYIIGRSLSQGRSAGVCAALGIGAGSIVHTLLGAFGLSAILATSASAFTVLKLAGCAYLLYQGIRMICDAPQTLATAAIAVERSDHWHIFRQGALTNILNPKVAVFFLAFMPQFISPAYSSKPLSFIVLGAIFITTGTLWCLVVALSASGFSRRLRRSANTAPRLRRANGLLFILLGLTLASAKLEL